MPWDCFWHDKTRLEPTCTPSLPTTEPFRALRAALSPLFLRIGSGPIADPLVYNSNGFPEWVHGTSCAARIPWRNAQDCIARLH